MGLARGGEASTIRGTTFRVATKDDCYEIARLFGIASGGVAGYVWSTLAPEYPGLTPLEIGARRYASEEGPFSYKNCVVAELEGEVIGMLHAYPMGEEPEEEEGADGPMDPVLEPYARLEIPGSFYVSGMAILPGHRGRGVGTRLLSMAGDRARELGLGTLSLLVFEQNTKAVRLYERNGFAIVDRAPVVPHELIRYTGNVLLMRSEV